MSEDKLEDEHTNHRLVFETLEGEMAAKVTITDLGADASPVLVEQLRGNCKSDLGHLVVDEKTTTE